MKLEARQYKELSEVLVDAFPTKAKLAQMLRFNSNKSLAAIVNKDGSLQDIVFELIETVEAEEWIVELIEAAREVNSNNSKLKAFESKIKVYILKTA